jgi:hypothetical protein
MAQADRIPTRAADLRQILAPADAVDAHRVALHRRLWADFGPDGEPLGGAL